MGLLHDAIDLVTCGQTLQASAQLEGKPVFTLAPHRNGGYLLQDDAKVTPVRHFRQPASAVRTFYRLVGTSGLSRAISDYRYRAMFPCGSSLEWAPIPLQQSLAAK